MKVCCGSGARFEEEDVGQGLLPCFSSALHPVGVSAPELVSSDDRHMWRKLSPLVCVL